MHISTRTGRTGAFVFLAAVATAIFLKIALDFLFLKKKVLSRRVYYHEILVVTLIMFFGVSYSVYALNFVNGTLSAPSASRTRWVLK